MIRLHFNFAGSLLYRKSGDIRGCRLLKDCTVHYSGMAEMKGLKHCILLLPVDVAIEYIGSASISLADGYVRVKVHCAKVSKLPVDVAVEFSVPRICQHLYD
jgi:hypothetical protein